jgi:hypothetical protein
MKNRIGENSWGLCDKYFTRSGLLRLFLIMLLIDTAMNPKSTLEAMRKGYESGSQVELYLQEDLKDLH